jgi:tRNA G18 (ribose-2'-O)-methylase SpoU
MPELIAIHDPADPRIEAYRDIRERDLVGRRGLFVAEGTVVLEKLVAGSAHATLSLLIADKRVAALEPLWSRLPDGVPVFVAAQGVVDAIAGFPLHRGVLGIGRRAEERGADAVMGEAVARDPGAGVLVLCGIANHDNMGGIFRNAAAFGVGAVLLDSDCCDPLYRKAIRVSAGAALTVPFARAASGAALLDLAERHALTPLALTPGGCETLDRLEPPARALLLLGTEGPGLPEALMARARRLRIAMAPGFDSLNVATAGAIALHHLAGRRLAG